MTEYSERARLVALAMTANGGDGRGSVRLSDRTIATQFGLDVQLVHLVVDQLVDDGWLSELSADVAGRRRFHLILPDALRGTKIDRTNTHR